MIVVTGAAGFIGSALVYALNKEGHSDLIVVDKFELMDKWKNLAGLKFKEFIDLEKFLDHEIWDQHPCPIKAIYHMGACSSTTEQDMDYLYRNNTEYTNRLFQYATKLRIPFCYASSAATYGAGDLGYSDEHSTIGQLKPLNKYGYSKQLSDQWVLEQKHTPPLWFGVKFFNVFGPNEYHKDKMSSVVFQAFHQIQEVGEVKLFKSHRPDYKDGEQLRDFIYVKDVVRAMLELMKLQDSKYSGIYNLGTGKARSFHDLVKATFISMNKNPQIKFIDMPEQLRNQYQYYTQAEMKKFKSALPYFTFMELEDAVKDYVQNHLLQKNPYLSMR